MKPYNILSSLPNRGIRLHKEGRRFISEIKFTTSDDKIVILIVGGMGLTEKASITKLLKTLYSSELSEYLMRLYVNRSS
jgi:rRNA pseudouridine-1189 N-methylase Emg1 (Nep1/Mra1 family)